MTRDQARRVLLAYRPESSDGDDPEVGEALELAQQDPSLQSWLEEQTAFYKSVRAQLRGISPPPGLRERILAQPKVIVPIWRRPEFLVAAACLGLGLIIAAFWLPVASKEETFAKFQSRMVGFAVRVYRMDIVTKDPAQVRQYLRAQGAPADYTLTPGLQQMPVKGGARLSWQGHPVAMVCFELPKDETLFMFVMEQAALRDGSAPGANPVITSTNGISTASWSRDGRVYLVAAAGDPGWLRKLLGAAAGRLLAHPSVIGFIACN